MKQSIANYNVNSFCQYLFSNFQSEYSYDAIEKYCIGTSKYWAGATVFWFIDIFGQVRAGQVKLFDNEGHSVKNHTTWIHSILHGKEQDHPWLVSYQQNSSKVSCLFGEHLLPKDPGKTVAIVEAPATAIIASMYFPKFTWLATGSLSYLSRDRCKNLVDRRVVLFPDLGGYDKWKKKAEDLRDLTKIKVSEYLERHATQHDHQLGLDLRDFLARNSIKEFKKQTELHATIHIR